MTGRYAYLTINVARVVFGLAAFSALVTAQQEPTPVSPPTALEILVETLGGRLSQDQQGRVARVDLYGTQITDAGLTHLTGLPALQFLGLGSTEVADAGLTHLMGLPALETLNLDGTQVTDVGLTHLTGLTGLKTLYLYGTQVTDAGLTHLTD